MIKKIDHVEIFVNSRMTANRHWNRTFSDFQKSKCGKKELFESMDLCNEIDRRILDSKILSDRQKSEIFMRTANDSPLKMATSS